MADGVAMYLASSELLKQRRMIYARISEQYKTFRDFQVACHIRTVMHVQERERGAFFYSD